MANIKKAFIIVIVIGLTFTAITAFAQSAKDALMGLKKLEARCQSGISYQDYSNALADAKFPVNIYIQSNDAKKYPELTESINKSMQHYEFVNTLWHEKMSGKPGEALHDGLILQKGEFGIVIQRLYSQTRTTKFLWATYYVFDSALPAIWGEASKELENTTKLYAKVDENKSDDIDKLKKENEQLKADVEVERLKRENENLKKQLEMNTGTTR
jgi:hypothetical protein